MTFLGKLLVFLNAILATALLAWSVSLYTNRIDWPNVTYDGKKLTEWPAIYNRDSSTNFAAYTDSLGAVAVAETQLASRERLLFAKLNEAKTGKFYDLILPNARAGRQTNFELDPAKTAPTRVPRSGGGMAELQGVEFLRKSLQDEAVATTQAKTKLVETRTKLIEIGKEVAALNGSTDPMKTDPGIIGRLRIAILQRQDEARYLGDSQVNWDAQLITLEKRNKQLQDRLQALGVRPAATAPAASPVLTGTR